MQPQPTSNEIREFYGLTLEFNTTIAAGATAQAYSQVDTSGDFFIQNMRATVWIPSAATAIAGTPFANGSLPTAASDTFPTLAHCRLMLEVSGVQWFNNPVRLNHLAGDGGNPYFFQTLPALALQAQLLGTLYNDSALAVQAQVVLFGYKRLRG